MKHKSIAVHSRNIAIGLIAAALAVFVSQAVLVNYGHHDHAGFCHHHGALEHCHLH